ncbi:MAG: PIG-L family deacetylase [Defluviitaleaceae bacterium]|nr:PIG-L family deacetylase [Defluviitaleaceae bacterium]MCL2835491.1 PIG-L family deacetylase [Defluviitaleaceae bacterium]
MNISFSKSDRDIFIPDGTGTEQAFARTTHMGIGAHQDDLEFMSYDGILKCFGHTELWYTGVVVSNGAGSPRDGLYASYTDEDMKRARVAEQRKAAYIGEYAVCVQLMHSSEEIKENGNDAPVQDITKLLRAARPRVVYTHNPADKHDTHVAVALRVIKAIRSLPPGERPETLYGCELWRGLDWLCDGDKTVFDVGLRPGIGAALAGVFDSQITGGKSYDSAVLGRRRANATFLASHFTDKIQEAIYGIDMSRFITDETLDPESFIEGYINRFKSDALNRISKFK